MEQCKGGVYKIVNKLNNKIYIGSSEDILRRWSHHKSLLLRNKHTNRHMQNDFNKLKASLGECEDPINSILEFSFLEFEDDKKKRDDIEQKYLDKYFDNYKNCYNHMSKVIYTYGSKDYFKSEEFKKRVSERSKAFYSNPENRRKISEKMKIIQNDPEFKRKQCIRNKEIANRPDVKSKIIEKRRDKHVFTEKSKKKMIESMKNNGHIKPFYLKDSFGIVYYVEFVSKWAKENKIRIVDLIKLRDGKISEYKGYRLYKSVEQTKLELCNNKAITVTQSEMNNTQF